MYYSKIEYLKIVFEKTKGGRERIESNISLVITSSFKTQHQEVFFKAHEVSKTGVHTLKDTDMEIMSPKIRPQEGALIVRAQAG